MICKKCDGQGLITRFTQLDGGEDDVVAGTMAALMTFGLSLLVTTRTKEVVCPRCQGIGEVGK